MALALWKRCGRSEPDDASLDVAGTPANIPSALPSRTNAGDAWDTAVMDADAMLAVLVGNDAGPPCFEEKRNPRRCLNRPPQRLADEEVCSVPSDADASRSPWSMADMQFLQFVCQSAEKGSHATPGQRTRLRSKHGQDQATDGISVDVGHGLLRLSRRTRCRHS